MEQGQQYSETIQKLQSYGNENTYLIHSTYDKAVNTLVAGQKQRIDKRPHNFHYVAAKWKIIKCDGCLQ